MWGNVFIEVITILGLGKKIRGRGAVAARHAVKEGTPTFGGILIILVVLSVALVLNAVNIARGNFEGKSILVPLGALIGFGLLGAYDDWEGIRGVRAREGVSARAKFLVQVALAVVTTALLFFPLGIDYMIFPLVPVTIEIGYWYFLIAPFILLAAANGSNFTDGLDGLDGNVSAVAFGSYGVIALLQEQIWLADFCFIMMGAIFGFLWYNAHPAMVFMGDTGSQAIGSVLGIVALMSGHWLLLPVIAPVFVVEIISVVLQKSFMWYTQKYLGEKRRIFKQAPIHHHFELLGWSETQIVFRFTFLSLLMGLIGIGLAMI
jgi:phospho-N-acetylmuramoyl-pentapeptide-transferase